jgi:hypothetical protein
MFRVSIVLAILATAAAGCSRPPVPPPAEQHPQPAAAPAPQPTAPAVDEVEPPAPGQPGGLPDDRTPISEAPFLPTSPQGAANVAQTYYALIGEGRYADAWALWSGGGQASGLDRAAFVASFAPYASYHAQVGGPSDSEGAAGSIFVQVPVVIYGRLKTGAELHRSGVVTLRRVNDVPGSSAEQRRWHISRIDLKP